MKKERLYILVYLDKTKILIRNLKSIEKFKSSENDMFIYVRDELFFGENGILELADYYNIPNLEDVMNESLKKVFFTPFVINLHYTEFMKTTTDSDLYHELEELYTYFIELSEVLTLEEFKNSSNYEEFQETLFQERS